MAGDTSVITNSKENKKSKEANGQNNNEKSEKTEEVGFFSQPFNKQYKSVIEKLNTFKDNITVEPMLACYIMPSVLASLATQNLNLEKACRVNLKYEKHVCDALSARDTTNYTMEESEVQQLVAHMQGWKTVIQSTLPCLLILFFGAWSDRVGRRKPCMLLPIIGEFLTSVGLIINTYFFDELPMEVAGVTEALFPGITGGWFTMFMGIFSYIADVTTEENRTFRIGFVNLFCSLGVPIGMALSGVLLREIGFYGVFSVSAVLYMISFCYGYFLIDEPERLTSSKENLATKLPQGFVENVKCFFDLEHVKDTFVVTFKRGPGNRRLRVTMLMIVVCVVIGPLHGEMVVMYLFTRFRFNWNEVDFSIFSTYSMITNLIGTLFSVGVFSHMMKLDDAIIGILSSMSKILSSFMYAFAVTNWQIYMAPLMEIFNGTSFIAMRSIVSKLVPSDELGKVNSLFGVCEGLMPLVYGPMYTSVYSATLNSLPGAFFLLGGALTAPAVLIFGWMYTVHKKERLRKEEEEKSESSSGSEDKGGVINTAFQKDEESSDTLGDIRISNMIGEHSDVRGSKRLSLMGEHSEVRVSKRLSLPHQGHLHRPSLGDINMAETIMCTSKIN